MARKKKASLVYFICVSYILLLWFDWVFLHSLLNWFTLLLVLYLWSLFDLEFILEEREIKIIHLGNVVGDLSENEHDILRKRLKSL